MDPQDEQVVIQILSQQFVNSTLSVSIVLKQLSGWPGITSASPCQAGLFLQAGKSVANILIQALPLYEYVITLDLEYSVVWRRKLTATSFLLITTRWAMVLAAVLQFWAPHSDRVSRPRFI